MEADKDQLTTINGRGRLTRGKFLDKSSNYRTATICRISVAHKKRQDVLFEVEHATPEKPGQGDSRNPPLPEFFDESEPVFRVENRKPFLEIVQLEWY